MDQYDKQMFDFLTQEQNLKGLILAKNQFVSVQQKLIINLWDTVYNNLRKHFDGNPRWEPVMDKQIFYSRSKIYLRDKKLTILQNRLPSFLFGWERLANSYPYFGFWINQEFNDFKVLEVSDYFNKRRNEIACGFQESEDGWLFWDKEGQLDFNNDNCLVYIIPSRLESKALELTHLLINLFNDMEVCYYSMIDGGTFRV